LIEAAARGTNPRRRRLARRRLTGRRFLDLQGPFGVGFTAIEAGNDVTAVNCHRTKPER